MLDVTEYHADVYYNSKTGERVHAAFPVMHTDCTNARESGNNCYVHVCATPDGKALYFARSLSGRNGKYTRKRLILCGFSGKSKFF